MNTKKTNRGFVLTEFTDLSGRECSVQESSIIHNEGVIWLGCSDIGLKHFKAGQGWHDVELSNTIEEHYVANNRMHLTQTQVKELLPVLAYFAEHGNLPDE